MVICPVCGWLGDKFLEFGNPPRKNAQCPSCKSKERHRYLFLFLKSILPTNKKLSVLHIAPSEALRKLFLSYPKISYLSVDINPERLKATKKEDLTKLSFQNDAFNIIICVHVLEHIHKDIIAMREMRRVLKNDGFAIIQVPMFNIEKTREDKNCTIQERFELFGQEDHVRAYGSDFEKRLGSAGFRVKKINFLKKLSRLAIKEYGLIHQVEGTPLQGKTQEEIYFCEKKY